MSLIPPLADSEEDPGRLWAEIHTLRAEMASPVPGKTWRDLAVEERNARVKAQSTLRFPIGWLIEKTELGNFSVEHEGLKVFINPNDPDIGIRFFFRLLKEIKGE